jgi:hypothetical protein
MPQTAQRKITIAREASNFQKRNVMVTGMAFWTEKIETRNNAINRMIIVAIDGTLLDYLFLAFAVRFLAVFEDAAFFPSSVTIRASAFFTRVITAFTLLSRRGFFPLALRA